MNPAPKICVLAGVNGAGKSSIAGEFAGDSRNFFYNPDTVAAQIRQLHPDISLTQANAHAWQIGKELLEQAIAEGRDYRFETTLGGSTITRLLEKAARAGFLLHVWFCGLESPELHIKRVRARVARGGHDIPEAKIRERWASSRANLIRILPLIHHLRVCDNSAEADPFENKQPQPVLLLEMREGRTTVKANPDSAPEWVVPILEAAFYLDFATRQGKSPRLNPEASPSDARR